MKISLSLTGLHTGHRPKRKISEHTKAMAGKHQLLEWDISKRQNNFSLSLNSNEIDHLAGV